MKILIVDDDLIIRLILTKFFGTKNLDVITAHDGRDALEKINKLPNHFDVVITDIMMPVMNGIELSSKIKEDNPSLKIIVITAGDLEQIEGYESLFIASFNKPLELELLYQTVMDTI